ncbi:patatin-like phospholipase family protein [Hydrogenovibrio sp. 3SP14C1]|uniref:patatin-like phospholipase family protein n=1 Tax=Hydrogenovibrio sp. 3SP14C1 TaxID=3038774 RepID=UPI002415A8D9|nr:patatin-like phospholipase family protein [Hydrogenovibrio sp. 3SP14C1]MDG4811723.1 patatin-like phospholipase family protein [Hydrogenovibrio sp. 3SP14C1]
MAESKENKKTVSLVLGSGGARGWAHIGVIRWLEENNYEIRSVTGCSIGALVGGVYAAGKLDEFEEWVCSIRKVDIVTLLDLSWERSGLVKGDKIIKSLVDLVGNQMIEDLPITYTAVASDIVRQREIWLQSGRLFDAIRASISLPLFFTPFNYHGVDLIDGGVLNPVPIAPAFSDKTDMILAVSLSGEPEGMNKIEKIESHSDDEKLEAESQKTSEVTEVATTFYEKLSGFFSKFREHGDSEPVRHWSVYEIADLAFDSMQSTIARQKLAAYPPDKVIEIANDACGSLEFDRATEMIELGYQFAEKTMKKQESS